jgi:hypothetical protein
MTTTDSGPYRITLGDFTIPFVSFGVLLGIALMAAETQMDLGMYRTIYTIWVTTALVTPALCAFALPGDSDRIRNAWLLFWTFSFIAYLVHAGYAFFSVYQGSIQEFLSGQGIPAAIINVVFTLWWALDVLLAWFYHAESRWVRIERVAAHIFIALTFFVSTVFLKHGFINVIGVVLAVSVIICLMMRFDSRRKPLKARVQSPARSRQSAGA